MKAQLDQILDIFRDFFGDLGLKFGPIPNEI